MILVFENLKQRQFIAPLTKMHLKALQILMGIDVSHKDFYMHMIRGNECNIKVKLLYLV